MKVFHYLKDKPLFDLPKNRTAEEGGAVYNDFNHSLMELLRGDKNSFSYSQLSSVTARIKARASEAVEKSVQEATDHAVMVANRVKGVHYDYLSWRQTFSTIIQTYEKVHCKKVFKLATNMDGCWDEIVVTKEA